MKRLFDLKGLNFWLLGTALGLNFLWALLLVIISFSVISRNKINNDFIQVIILAASFLGPFVIGWVIAKMAADLHGLSYGFLGSIGSLIPIVVVLVPTGLFGVITALTAILGGLNGGLFGMRNLKKEK